MRSIALEELHRKFDYEESTGVFTNKESYFKSHVGRVAGCLHHSGYRYVRINGVAYAEHRLAWLYVTGENPNGYIDHIDGNRSNNAFSNLRIATREQNNSNAKRRVDNKSGIKGIDWHNLCNKWQCRVQSGKKRITIGYYDSIEEATNAIKDYRETVHKEFTNHGE